MKNLLMITQAIISVLLTVIVLVQSKDEGLSATFQANQSFQSTRRGAEKVVFTATIVLAVLFILNATLFVFFK